MFQLVINAAKITTQMSKLSKQVSSFSIRLTCMQWAFGIIVTIIIAYGFGSGWTFLKISDREKQKMEDEIKKLPSKADIQKLENMVIPLNGWNINKGNENFIEVTRFSNIKLYRIYVVAKISKVTENFNAFMQTPESLDVPEGYYPIYYHEGKRWVTAWVDHHGQWSVNNLKLNQKATLYINLSGQSDR